MRKWKVNAPECAPVRVAVCDNEKIFLDLIAGIVQKSIEPQSLILRTFSDPAEMLKSGESFQIAVLDIQMPQMTGIDLAAIITERSPDCQIIFVSNYMDYVTAVYDTPHLCFILKSRVQELLPRYLLRARQSLDRLTGDMLSITYHSEVTRIPERNILYIERVGRLSSVVCWNANVHTTPERIEQLSDKLSPECFCRCHASFIVGLRYVATYERTEFVMTDGKHIPISRAHSRTSKQAFSRFIGEQL